MENEEKSIDIGKTVDYNTLEKKNDEINKVEIGSSPLIDEIVNNKGYYSLELWKVMALVSLILGLEGIHLTTFGIILIPFKEYFHTSSKTISVISALMFISIGLGSLVVGFLSSKFSRKSLITLSSLLMFVFNLAMSYCDSLILFSACRCGIGFFMGIAVPLLLCIMTEYLPVHLRSFALSMIWTPFCFGTLFQLLVVYLVMPTLEADKTQHVIFYISFPSLLSGLLYFFFLNDSPRSLIIHDKTEEAFVILERIKGSTLSQEEKHRIISQVKFGENKNFEEGSIASMFKPQLLKTTILLILIWAINAFIYYCPMIIMSLTLTKLGLSHTEDHKNSNIIMQEVIINLISIIGYFVAGVLSEITYLGRKYSVCFGFLGFAILTGLSIVYPKSFELFLGLETIFTTITLNVVCTYTLEVYPTKVRNTAGGFLYFFARVSGFFSQYFGISLDKLNTFMPYYFTLIFSLIGVFLTAVLPYETQGHFLDINFEDEVEMKHPKIEGYAIQKDEQQLTEITSNENTKQSSSDLSPEIKSITK